MRFMDFSSWQTIVSSILGLALFALIGVGIRVLMMLTIQQRQSRMNRQINESLRTLMSAYRTLGGSFTGSLEVDPSHLRQLRHQSTEEGIVIPAAGEGVGERTRQIRDAVEAALSDIMLLGTVEQVRMAAGLAKDMALGNRVQTGELVNSLRDYIREALGLERIPRDIVIPLQGPTRPQSGPRGKGGEGGRGGQGGGGGGGGGQGGMGGGGGIGMGMGIGMSRRSGGDEGA